jgi:hypothetical protein
VSFSALKNLVELYKYTYDTVDRVRTDPGPGGKTGILVEVDGTDTNAQVAQKTAKAMRKDHELLHD